jgi:hypothetical protein
MTCAAKLKNPAGGIEQEKIVCQGIFAATHGNVVLPDNSRQQAICHLLNACKITVLCEEQIYPGCHGNAVPISPEVIAKHPVLSSLRGFWWES